MTIEYRITDKGRKAEPKPSDAGKVIEYLQRGHAIVNVSEIKYELGIVNAQEVLDMLTQGGYIDKVEAGRKEGFSLW